MCVCYFFIRFVCCCSFFFSHSLRFSIIVSSFAVLEKNFGDNFFLSSSVCSEPNTVRVVGVCPTTIALASKKYSSRLSNSHNFYSTKLTKKHYGIHTSIDIHTQTIEKGKKLQTGDTENILNTLKAAVAEKNEKKSLKLK